MSLNSKLFTMDNLPVKMCLHGFPFLDTLKITKQIIMHGGMVTTEPDKYTIVLSNPSCSSRTKYAHFDIKWLHDCIAENKYLSAMKYMLPSSTKVENLLIRQILIMRGSQDVSEQRPYTKEEIKDEPEGDVSMGLSHTTEMYLMSPKKEDISLLEESNCSMENDMHVNQCTHRYSKRLRNAIIKTETNLSTLTTDLDCKPESKRRRSSVNSAHSRERSIDRYSLAENQQMINYVIENNAIAVASSRATWKKAKAKGMFEHPCRSSETLRRQFHNHLRHNFRQYTSDPVALMEFEKLEKRE